LAVTTDVTLDSIQDDHFSEKPGNVGGILQLSGKCQEDWPFVRELSGESQGKNCVGENCCFQRTKRIN